jgi:predicted RNA-binding protein with PIN domain
MPLLIDGYNLLHATGIVGSGSALTELHRSREALLRYLAASIDPTERPRTTIVFDAAGAPPGLPRTLDHEGITVHFARDYADADAMLEELIAAHDTPRSLVVVSSDHRVQRAARRRRATAIDSDRWYAELCATRRRGTELPTPPQKPTGNLSADEVNFWLSQFAVLPQDNHAAMPDVPDGDDLDNPFPPGYADDLLDDENRRTT